MHAGDVHQMARVVIRSAAMWHSKKGTANPAECSCRTTKPSPGKARNSSKSSTWNPRIPKIPRNPMGIDSPEEINEIRELFESFPQSEQRRLIQLFTDGMESQSPVFQIDWRDRAPDGTEQVPGTAMKKSSGL